MSKEDLSKALVTIGVVKDEEEAKYTDNSIQQMLPRLQFVLQTTECSPLAAFISFSVAAAAVAAEAKISLEESNKLFVFINNVIGEKDDLEGASEKPTAA